MTSFKNLTDAKRLNSSVHISIWMAGVYYLIDRYPELWQGVVGRRVSGRAVELQQQDRVAAEEWRDGASSAGASEEELLVRTAPEHTSTHST